MAKHVFTYKLYVLLIIALNISLGFIHGNDTISINEVELDPFCHNSYNDCLEWVELYNYGDKAINLGGWSLSSNSKSIEIKEGTIIEPRGFYCIQKFGWLNDESSIINLSNTTYIIDTFGPCDDDPKGRGDSWTWSRCPDGNGKWFFIAGSENATNNCRNITRYSKMCAF